ncbi:MAG: signal peptidase I [Acidobacteria bacterium]|nr:signal peptidase I [Acidobacteriota bacterium]
MKTSSRISAFIIVLAIIIPVAGISYYLYLFRVVSAGTDAMANSILQNDKVLCTKKVGSIERGDVVVFKYPRDPRSEYLMRVIGLPGETIQLQHDSILINGVPLAEAKTMVDLDDRGKVLKEISSQGQGKYRAFYAAGEAIPNQFDEGAKYGVREPFLIPQGEYFLLGDNRDKSFDSRYWGSLQANSITGKVILIFASKSKESGE